MHTQIILALITLLTTSDSNGALIENYQDKDFLEFIPFEKTQTPSPIKSMIFKDYPHFTIIKTPFPYEPIPINSKFHIEALLKNTFTIINKKSDLNTVVVSGLNNSYITIAATTEDSDKICIIDKYDYSSTTACTTIIRNTFEDSKTLKILLYSVEHPSEQYHRAKETQSCYTLDKKLGQKSVIHDCINTLQQNLALDPNNLTVAYIKHKPNLQSYFFSLLIKPAGRSKQNPWGACNTTIDNTIYTVRTNKSFWPSNQETRSFGNFQEHFLAMTYFNFLQAKYDCAGLIYSTTNNCGSCSQCLHNNC